MEKLTLEHIAPYLPYGLKFGTPSGRVSNLEFNDNGLQIAKKPHPMAYTRYTPISFSNALRDNKPLLYPLSSLTKPMEDGSVPIKYIVEEILGKELDGVAEGAIKDFIMSLNDLYFTKDYTDNIRFSHILKIIEYLCKMKINFMNLPEHLWIDVTTLPENPYK